MLVMKQIDISQMDRTQRHEALSEASILQSLSSPYIVSYHSSFIESEKLCIVMEYCENNDLARLLQARHGQYLEEDTIWKYFIEISLALLYLHNRKILHRDIKTMNVFLTKDFHVRLGDLGVAKVLSQNANFAHKMVGTPYYLSPELCREKPYNDKSDIWSLGCLLYELCALKHPFEARNQAALTMKIVQGRYDSLPNIYSKDLASMVTQCLQKDYKKRYSIHEILSLSCVQLKARSLGIEIPDKNTLSLKVIKRAHIISNPENPLKSKEERKKSESKFVEQKLESNNNHEIKLPIGNIITPKEDIKKSIISKPYINELKKSNEELHKGNLLKVIAIDKKMVGVKNSRLTPQRSKNYKEAPKSRVNKLISNKPTQKKVSKDDYDAINYVINLPDLVGNTNKKEEKPYILKKPKIEELIEKSAVEINDTTNNESHENIEEVEVNNNTVTVSSLENTTKLLAKKQNEYKERTERFEKKKSELALKIPLASIDRCCKLASETRTMVSHNIKDIDRRRRRLPAKT